MSHAPDRAEARRRRRVRWSALAAALGIGAFATIAGAEAPADTAPATAPPFDGAAPPDAPHPPPPPPGPGGPGHHRERPPFDAILAHEAGRLGLDDATLAHIRALADAARPESEALESELRDERDAMRSLLQTDSPDLDAVLRQAERVGAAETALEKQRLTTMLEIRKLLTPAQRAELVKIFRERKPPRGPWRRDKGAPPPPP